jgi:hypothetical protein
MSKEEIVQSIIGIAIILGLLGVVLQFLMYGTLTEPCC